MSFTAPKSFPKRTYGEQLVARLLDKLPSDEYYAVAEPNLIDRDGQGWKPDFVIVSAHHGVIILEIKDWRRIEDINRETVVIKKSNDTLETLPNPVHQAQNYAYILADLFQKREELMVRHNNVKKLAFPWQYAVALPNIANKTIRQIEGAGIWEHNVALGKDDLESPETLARALRKLPWRFKMEQRISMTSLDVIRGVLNPSLKIKNERGEDVGTETHLQTQLIEEELPQPQLPGMEKPDAINVRLLRGVAGSGKSLVLVRRAARLTAKHPEAKIAIMAFNRDLSDKLREKIDYELKDQGIVSQNIDVMDFHQMCIKVIGAQEILKFWKWRDKSVMELIQQSELSPNFVADEIAWRKEMELYDNEAYLDTVRTGRATRLPRDKRQIINTIFDQYLDYQQARKIQNKPWMDWEDIPKYTAEALLQGHNYAQRYDAILVDEGQDFAPIWFEVIKLILKPNGVLMVCDDPTQSLFRYYSWRQKGLDVVGRTRILRIPFRNTRQISLAAHSVIQADALLKNSDEIPSPNFKTYDLADGVVPLNHQFADSDAEIAFVQTQIHALLKQGIASSQVAILCESPRQAEIFKPLQVDTGIYVSNFAKMKGLEFQAVILPFIDTLFDERVTNADENFITEQRRKLFTAMTRACDYLVLTHCGDLPKYIEGLKAYVQSEVGQDMKMQQNPPSKG